MKVSVYSVKGSAGKTPISVNFMLDHEFALGTNEPYHVLDSFIPDDLLLSVEHDESFPEIPDDIDIVFDLAGSISKTANSINSALKQSDVVIVPIYDEVKSIKAGIHTIIEVSNFCKNIIVVATKLEKNRKEVFNDWSDSESFKNIKEMVIGNKDKYPNINLSFSPLKFSTAFNAIFEQEKSIKQIMKSNKLLAHSYAEVSNQMENIYKEVSRYASQK